jgi:hypothetical protein
MIKSVKRVGRGGKRLGAGRPSTWHTRDFKTIRVPISLAGQVKQPMKFFEWQFDIFWCSPTSTASEGGRLCQGGKEKFVTRLGFRRARVEGRNEEF